MSAMPDEDEYPGFDVWSIDAWIMQCAQCGEQMLCTGPDETTAWVNVHACPTS